jgi:hypothetical protein
MVQPARALLVAPGSAALLLLSLFWPCAAARSELRDGGIDPANLGKGDWIYCVSDATNKLGGHVSAVTNETSLMQFYRSQGIRYLIVKAATSDQLFSGCLKTPQFTGALVGAAHVSGLWIFGYSRSYGANVKGEITIANYVFHQGADGFVWDAEGEWESANPWIGAAGGAKAWQLCSTVRSNWPTKFLAYAPFPIISYHVSFPYKEFGYWCDAVMPQIYHAGWTGVVGSVSGGMNWADVNWANWQKSLAGSNWVINGATVYWTNAIKPLAPVAEVYGPPGHSPCCGTTPALNNKDVMELVDYLAADPNCPTPGGYKGVSFWRADLHGPTQWAHIKQARIGDMGGEVKNIVLDDDQAIVEGSWDHVRTFADGLFSGNGTGTDTNSFGTNYLTHAQGSGSGVVLFTPAITKSGDYDVYEWHPFRKDASAGVPFIISHAGGETTIYANQRTNSGNWNLLGRFNFATGTTNSIRIIDAVAETNAVAIVDGLKLVFVTAAPEGQPQPQNGQNRQLSQ